jgi:hypothetical protein
MESLFKRVTSTYIGSTSLLFLSAYLAERLGQYLDVSEKMHKAIFDRDTATAASKTASKTLRKELADAKKELAEVESTSRNSNGSTSRHNGMKGDSMERLREKERIKLDAFEQKTAIACRNKEKDKRRKMDAKRDNMSRIQALGGRNNPFVQSSCSSSRCSRMDQGGRHHCHHSSRGTGSRSSHSSSRNESTRRDCHCHFSSRSKSGKRDRGHCRKRSKSRGWDHSHVRYLVVLRYLPGNAFFS